MTRIKMILPVPLPAAALAHFAAQIPQGLRRPGVQIDFAGCRAGASLLDSPYEWTLADAFVLDAGIAAQAEGYDGVCSFSMSDSGVPALRSRLTIPVMGAAQAAFAQACLIGKRFSIVTMWEPWRAHMLEMAARYGMRDRLASVRHIGVRPDTSELLSGKEEFVFARLEAAARRCIDEDGADTIVLGSTTMYQAHAHLASTLPCPVLNPGWCAFKALENWLDMGLVQSALAYARPERGNDAVFEGVRAVY
ncbi:aspartate/glutamate racemase family protein [Paraburkholderia acidisoli]|uniref:Hydrogenase expression protein HupH n=1 Tax=Paraburkholderia acidisoli TaxID=2571748 RepID=A0A7Z2GS97_9BURK|nr:aspartate/glutamate racemase family protein [Paraburkholderia acidisoli]QGZ66664.1 hydrogenase expression protein HupH [Paraburkholderia acidisoli]